MAYIKIDGFLCERCWHRWVPRQPNMPDPKNCPKCKSPYWNKPRKVPAQGNPAWRNATNLKDIINEMEDEYLLRKLGL